jgi:hypothetical protein
MAWFFVFVAIAGFAPRSLAIVDGLMPSPPLVVHLHAAASTSQASADSFGADTIATTVSRRRRKQTPSCSLQATTRSHRRNNIFTFRHVGSFSLDAL